MKELIEAVLDRDIEKIRSLSQQSDFNPNGTNRAGTSALMLAAKNGDINIMNLLISLGADVNYTINQACALHWVVAFTDNVEALRLLVANGANISVLNANAMTPLHVAVLQKHNDIVRELLSLGARIDAQDSEGQTPLHYAAATNSPFIFEALTDDNSVFTSNIRDCIDITDEKGFTCAHYATILNQNNLFEYLEKAGTKVDAEQFVLRRDLANIFNIDRVNALLSKNDGFDYGYSGGFLRETVDFFIEMLDCYDDHNPTDRNASIFILKSILTFKKKIFEFELSDANLSEAVVTSLEHVNHEIPMLIRPTLNPLKIKLSFFERGPFAQRHPKTGRIMPEFSITIPKIDFEKVKAKLGEFKNADEEAARKILFEDIPAIVQSNYFPGKFQQHGYRNARCYFENFRSLILSLCIEKLGIQKGKERYKNMIYFISFRTLKKYMNESTDKNKKQIESICMQNLLGKREKLVKTLSVGAEHDRTRMGRFL